MPKIDMENTVDVKALLLDVMVENRELRDELGQKTADSNYWFNRFVEQERKIDALTADLNTIRGAAGAGVAPTVKEESK